MRLLLDSHVVLWWSGFDADKLSGLSRRRIAEADAVFISMASVWELEIKQSLGKLTLAVEIWQRVQAAGMTLLPISFADVGRAVRLPHHHGDPFDRMILAHVSGTNSRWRHPIGESSNMMLIYSRSSGLTEPAAGGCHPPESAHPHPSHRAARTAPSSRRVPCG
jgi:PIN domain nuclease of toxin-antitoxin system